MTMLILLIFFGLLVILAIMSLQWGVDSRDGINSREWSRKLNHPQHHL